MPRRPRSWLPDGFFHVVARGNRRQLIFHEPRDYERFLVLLRGIAKTRSWSLYAHCLMPNHFHLLLRAMREDLSIGMHRLNGKYAHWFNKKYDLSGHVFQGRYEARVIANERYLATAARYVVMNPVRAGLCASPRVWRWSAVCEELAAIYDEDVEEIALL